MNMGEMSTGNNRLVCIFVCKKERACDGCILRDAQSMTEAVRYIKY